VVTSLRIERRRVTVVVIARSRGAACSCCRRSAQWGQFVVAEREAERATPMMPGSSIGKVTSRSFCSWSRRVDSRLLVGRLSGPGRRT